MQPDDTAPLDAADPRFPAGAASVPPRPPRRLVPSRGPGPAVEDPLVARLRVGLRVIAVAAVALVAWIFFVGLDPGRPVVRVGSEAAVRAALGEGPRRVCQDAGSPCTWLSLVDGELLALSTSGPLREERGNRGVAWCPGAGVYVAGNTGSRFDADGDVIAGPAPRGLDAYRVAVVDGQVEIDFSAVRSGRLARRGLVTAAATPSCPASDTPLEVPLDR